MKKISVTVGIPALNEEQNIKGFLLSILNQKLNNVCLNEIIVYSDASTDHTDEIVQKLSKKNKLIKLVKGKTRKGKYFRVNELFQKNKSDVIIILDADIALGADTFIEELTTLLINDPKAVMLAAHNTLIRPKEFIAKVLYTHFMLWDFIRLSGPDLQIADNFYGSATAYRRRFARSLHIPADLTDPHFYIYLSAKKINGFRYSTETHVLQYAPATIEDLKKLQNRTIGKKDKKLEALFGEEEINNAHYASRKTKIAGIVKCFFKEPFYTPLALFISFYSARIAQTDKADKSPLWEINTSTKKPIAYAK